MKANWRSTLRTRFAEMPSQERDLKTEQLLQHLTQFLNSGHVSQGSTWCLYQALESEILLSALPARTPHLHWVYPKVINSQLQFLDPQNGFEKSYAGILEPVLEGARSVDLKDISGFLIPGLGFDQTGARMGKGKGFYDRALSNYAGVKIGVGFSTLIVEKLPTDPWDIGMDYLATETGVKRVGC